MEQDRTSPVFVHFDQLARQTLTSLEVVLELISHTTTNEGGVVTAPKDIQTYPTGLKVSDENLAALNLVRNAFHGEWTSTSKPQTG